MVMPSAESPTALSMNGADNDDQTTQPGDPFIRYARRPSGQTPQSAGPSFGLYQPHTRQDIQHATSGENNWPFRLSIVAGSGDYPYDRPETEKLDPAWETATFDDENEAQWARQAEAKGERKKRQDAFKAPIYDAYMKHAQDHDAALLARWTETLNILLTFVSRFWYLP